MIRRLAAVGLLSMASVVFAFRFSPPVTSPEDIDEVLETIPVAVGPPEESTTSRPSFGTLPPTTTTTTVPLPPGVRQYDSPYVNFARGLLQLRITVEWGQLADVEMIRVPSSSRRAKETSTEAGEILRVEALATQDYRLHVVSGATETSWMYMRALRDVMREADFCVDPKCDMPLR
jgi:uncharacterized protein with FMN-binding domain